MPDEYRENHWIQDQLVSSAFLPNIARKGAAGPQTGPEDVLPLNNKKAARRKRLLGVWPRAGLRKGRHSYLYPDPALGFQLEAGKAAGGHSGYGNSEGKSFVQGRLETLGQSVCVVVMVR